MNYFEIKLKRETEEGKVAESYLITAETFSDAETSIVEKAELTGDFVIDAVKKTRVSEVFHNDGRWFLAKVAFTTIDEKSGTEKVSLSNMYVQADGFDAAYKSINENMKGTMSDWYLSALSETAILEVYDDTATA